MTRTDTSRTRLDRRTLLAAMVALSTTAAGAAQASVVLADPVEFVVVDRDTGQALPVWRHRGRLFVAGEPGARYSLRVTNHTDGRVLVVMSVDGVNIVTGETASYDQRGYVFDPHESYDVSGWRKSNAEVAAFSFAPLPQSYAARTGRPGDVGVIGMAVFRERPLFRPLGAESRTSPAPPPGRGRALPLTVPAPPALVVPAPPAANSTEDAVVTGDRLPQRDLGPDKSEKLGTAHGPREWSTSRVVAFVRATPYPQFTRQIEYDTYDNLVASGVIPRGRADEHRPRAFPAQPRGERYVPDPPDDR